MPKNNLLKSILETCIKKNHEGNITWNEWRLLPNNNIVGELSNILEKYSFNGVDFVGSLGKSGIILAALISNNLHKHLFLIGGIYPDDPYTNRIHPQNLDLNDKHILLVDMILKRGGVIYRYINFLIKDLKIKPKSISVFTLLNVDCWNDNSFKEKFKESFKDIDFNITSIYNVKENLSFFEEVFKKIDSTLINKDIEKKICTDNGFWGHQEKKMCPPLKLTKSLKNLAIIHGNYIEIRRDLKLKDYLSLVNSDKNESCPSRICNGWHIYNEFIMHKYDYMLDNIKKFDNYYIATTQMNYLPIVLYISLYTKKPAFFCPYFDFNKESTMLSIGCDLKGKKFCLVEGETPNYNENNLNIITQNGGDIENIIFFPK